MIKPVGKDRPYAFLATSTIVAAALVAVVPALAQESFGSEREMDWFSEGDVSWFDDQYEFQSDESNFFRTAFDETYSSEPSHDYSRYEQRVSERTQQRANMENDFYTDDWFQEESAFERWYG